MLQIRPVSDLKLIVNSVILGTSMIRIVPIPK